MHCVFILSAGTAAVQFALSTVIVSAESVNGFVRVTWNATAPPQCVTSVAVEFRTGSHSGPVVASNTTNNASQTEFVQIGLQCGTNYYIFVDVTGETSNGLSTTVKSKPMQVLVSGGKFSYCKCAWEINLMFTHYCIQIYQLQLE